MKTAYFCVMQSRKTSGMRILAGPFPTFQDAENAVVEVNANLTTPPFAYVRRTASAKMTVAWVNAMVQS
jgi:hypothetical protein